MVYYTEDGYVISRSSTQLVTNESFLVLSETENRIETSSNMCFKTTRSIWSLFFQIWAGQWKFTNINFLHFKTNH